MKLIMKKIVILIVIILLISGCISEKPAAKSRIKVINKTVSSSNEIMPFWWYYNYYPTFSDSYGYGYNYGAPNTASNVYVVQRPSTEEGWDIKAPEIVKVTESEEAGKVSYQEEEISQLSDESLQQAVDEASSSNAINVGDVPGDSVISTADSSFGGNGGDGGGSGD